MNLIVRGKSESVHERPFETLWPTCHNRSVEFWNGRMEQPSRRGDLITEMVGQAVGQEKTGLWEVLERMVGNPAVTTTSLAEVQHKSVTVTL